MNDDIKQPAKGLPDVSLAERQLGISTCHWFKFRFWVFWILSRSPNAQKNKRSERDWRPAGGYKGVLLDITGSRSLMRSRTCVFTRSLILNSSPSFFSHSLLLGFLGHSHSCRTIWTPPGRKVLVWTSRTHDSNPQNSQSGFKHVCLLIHFISPVCSGHPSMGGPMRMNPPRGMGSMGPQVCINTHYSSIHGTKMMQSMKAFPSMLPPVHMYLDKR